MANATMMSGTPNTSTTIHGFRIYIHFTYEATDVPGQTKVSWSANTGYQVANPNYPATSTKAHARYSLSIACDSNVSGDSIISGSTTPSYDSGSTYLTFKSYIGIGSGSFVVQHNYLGAASVYVSGSFGIGGYNSSAGITLTLPTNVPNSATFSHGTSFYDTDKIAITYTNNVGADLTKIEVGLKDSNRNEIIALTAAATKPSSGNITSGTYNFDISSGLTKLYSLMPTANSLNVYLSIARTFSDGTVYTTNPIITITLKNPQPTLSLTVQDTNTTITNLTGNNQKFVLGYSNAKVTFNYSLKKSATLSSLQLTNASQSVLLSANGTISPIKDGYVKGVVVDSRGNFAEAEKTLTTVAYVKPEIKITSVEMVNDTTLKINTNTSGFYSSFGSKTNNFTIKYRWKVEGGSYSSWTSSGVANKTSSAAFASNFNFTTSNARLNHYIQVQVIDLLETVTSAEFLYSTGNVPTMFVKDSNNTLYELGFVKGTVPGASAYQLAKAAGFTGTEAQFIKQLLNPQAFPIGAIYTTFDTTEPGSLFGGTWTRLDQGAFIRGAANNQTTAVDNTVTGEATHTLSYNEMPNHLHQFPYYQSNNGYSGIWYIRQRSAYAYYSTKPNYWTVSTGGGQAHENMPPYYSAYVWQRVG